MRGGVIKLSHHLYVGCGVHMNPIPSETGHWETEMEGAERHDDRAQRREKVSSGLKRWGEIERERSRALHFKGQSA